jgi:hypothetical protein
MLPDERYIELTFEELVREPRKELERVTAFLGLPFEDGMTASYSNRAAKKVGRWFQDYHSHLTEAPSDSQAFKWKTKLGGPDQAVAFEIAGDLFEELGYPAGVKRHIMRIPRKCYHRCLDAYRWRLARLRLSNSVNSNGGVR